VVERYPRFSLYNSPYAAHEAGHAIDLYPPADTAPSPAAGRVIDTRSVRAPPKPYAETEDHLILLELDDPDRFDAPDGSVLRVLHVDPGVEAGDRVAEGDDLGRTIRSGFFAPWVGDHLHVGVRGPGVNPYRASGSLPMTVDVDVRGLPWDGTGTVVDRGETYAVLDRPVHPAPGRRYAAVGADAKTDPIPAIDGGVPHYDGGGRYPPTEGPVSFLHTRVGVAHGRTVDWDDVAVLANGDSVLGLSLFCGRETVGVKLVCPDREARDLPVGSEVRVTVARADDD
jgi:hypothetical protein